MCMERRISKVIYYDEGSVADCVQILSGGTMERTTELMENISGTGNASGKAGAGASMKGNIGGKLLASLLGSIEINGKLEGELSTTKNQIVKQVIKSTMLTDFLNLLNKNAKTDLKTAKIGDIVKFRNYSLNGSSEGITHELMNLHEKIMEELLSAEDKREISTIESTLKGLRYVKGYFDFPGERENDETVSVLRFNISCFKNGYTVNDLTDMSLCVYAVKVGHIKAGGNGMYDALLAGVEGEIDSGKQS